MKGVPGLSKKYPRSFEKALPGIFELINQVRMVGFDENLWRSCLIAGLCDMFRMCPGPMLSLSAGGQSHVIYEPPQATPSAQPADDLWGWIQQLPFEWKNRKHTTINEDEFRVVESSMPSELDIWLKLPGARLCYQQCSVGDVICGLYVLPEVNRLRCVSVVRDPTARTNSDVDKRLARLIFREIYRSVKRDVLSSRTMRARKPLSPREKQTLRRLLCGDSEKQIAHHLKVSPHTVHTYVKSLYRRFEVSSKGELMAHFVPTGDVNEALFRWELMESRLNLLRDEVVDFATPS